MPCARTFRAWGIGLRLAYRRRLRLAQRIGANGCSSWPSARVGAHGEPGSNPAHPTILDRWPTATQQEQGSLTRSESGGPPQSLSITAKAWPTPMRADAERSSDTITNRDGNWSLTGEARAWATPTSRDYKDGADPSGKAPTNSLLGRQAPRATGLAFPNGSTRPWPTPAANDDNKTPAAHLAMKKRMGERDGTGANRTAITSLAVLVRIGDERRRLNPLFVEWLMGWPLGWTDFAPVGTEWTRWSRLMRSELLRLSW